MRTREEQISALACMFESGPTFHGLATARRYILEAERRAEQHVRAEIGRDSERLDWLLARSYYGIPGFDPCARGRSPEKRKADLIRAIDAAREAE